ncbi:hypothetical protein A2801_01755 [Candidatus Woesebacteria bacterium RIFCSPHIGHO2_01_FULL_41_10]|uniref:Uncharacterized protein n=1 Tax=Candidatus Woesebacteria bacterium RIFCSPHIGHO2_01_FULL_41_10 TaxID=1802500 RepID=A0A1F7YMM5_9BACT|nr:MAG: hypothetical protein A2801_01755 [Candidatus Woesebacteria bacterium RIFCSPHIGHO2_01_FULL_41_10]
MTARKKQQSTHLVLYVLSSFVVTSLCLALLLSPREVNTRIVNSDSLNYDVAYWQAVVDENPTYRDGFVILSMLMQEKGEEVLATQYMQRVYEIDPFFKFSKDYYSSVLGVSADGS